MVDVELVNVFVEEKKKEIHTLTFGKPNTRWYVVVALTLKDKNTDSQIAEWFYLIVCSKAYLERPFKKGPTLDDRYLVVQDEFNLDKVFAIAKEKFAKIDAQNWEEFYIQMKKEFLRED